MNTSSSNRSLSLLLALLIVAPSASFGQTADTDEVFELSPFTVSRSDDRGYRASSTVAGTRIQTKTIVEPRHYNRGATIDSVTNSIQQPLPGSGSGSPVFLVKPADSVEIHFAFGYYDDLEAARVAVLNNLLDQAREIIRGADALRYTPGPLQIAPGDNTKSKRARRAELTSYAHFSIIIDLPSGADVSDRVEKARRLMDGFQFNTETTRVFQGPAHLVLKNPNQYRGELLQAVAADVEKLSQAIGDQFLIYPNGLTSRVQAAQYSETEVELWIPYSYQFVSVHDRIKEDRVHQLAFVQAENANRCCASCARKP